MHTNDARDTTTDDVAERAFGDLSAESPDSGESNRAESAESTTPRAKCASDVSDSMAVSQRRNSETDPSEDSEADRIDLKNDLGMDLPPTEVTVDLTGNLGGWVLDVSRQHKWTVEGTNAWGEVTSVYDENGNTVPLPERVPTWLLRVCQLYGVDELAI